ncbi:unnamed protein product [Cuscuta campestris]|uniref:TF-B3 domain-containing protein n=1 Tax=Cuscuta campestris TaxID=132261 RepID=A0A484LJ69_9ASTE|nr:unnamed protein product [Cuscuta campestris]
MPKTFVIYLEEEDKDSCDPNYELRIPDSAVRCLCDLDELVVYSGPQKKKFIVQLERRQEGTFMVKSGWHEVVDFYQLLPELILHFKYYWENVFFLTAYWDGVECFGL